MLDVNQLNDPLQPENKSKKEFTCRDAELSEERAKDLDKLYPAPSSLPAGFSFDAENWLIYQEGQGDGISPIRICSRLEVVARTRDQVSENHGRLLEFTDPDGFAHQWAMPMELLAGDGTTYRQELLSKGLMIAPGSKARQQLTNYIQISTPRKTIRCAQLTGWNREKTAFVFHHGTVGHSGNEELILQSSSNLSTAHHSGGDLKDWQQMSALCVGNSLLILSLSIAFAPPLLYLLGAESGGIHLRGQSSTGKSSCLAAATSVWGGSEYVQQWRATANGLEGIAAVHNDSLLCLDEIGQMSPDEVGKAAYMLANGMGKRRADKFGNAQKQKMWRIFFLSSGEISLSEHMQEVKQKTRVGQEVRVLDVDAGGKPYGCFECLHEYANGKIFAETITELSRTHYGTAGKEFVTGILRDQELVIQSAKRVIEELSKKYVPSTASGQVHRVFNRFALISVAGELATSLGITGWNEGVAINAAMGYFNEWLRVRGDVGPQEEQQVLTQVRLFFEQHGESRFSPWDSIDDVKPSKTQLRVGFRKYTDKGEEFFVFRESFKKDICNGFASDFVAQVCLKHGLLLPGPKGSATRSERLPGSQGSARVYRFTSKVLEGDE